VEVVVKEPGSCSAISLACSSCWFLGILGILTSIIIGGTVPAYGFLFGQVIGALAEGEKNKVARVSFQIAMGFLGLGALSALAKVIQVRNQKYQQFNC